MEKIRKYWNRPSRSAYVFIAPSIILLILFNIIPLIMAFGLSFFDVPITMNHATFVGWDNFVEAFHLFCNCNRYYVENDFTFKYRLYNGCFTVNGIRKN